MATTSEIRPPDSTTAPKESRSWRQWAAPADRLVDAVRLVADGSMLLGPGVTRRLVADVAARRAAPAAVPGVDDLTAREREVVLAVARGPFNAEIAVELYVGEPTVKSHVP